MDDTKKQTATSAQKMALERGRKRKRNGDDTDGGRPPKPFEMRLKKGNIYLLPSQWAALERQAALWRCSAAEALRRCVVQVVSDNHG